MRRALPSALLPALAVLLPAPRLEAGEPATFEDFLLESADGQRISLQREDPARKLTVLCFLDVDCDVTKQLAKGLGECERQHRAQGVRFLGIDVDRGDGAPTLSSYAAEHDLEFPLLLDPWGVVMQRAGATRSGEVIVLDPEFRVVYRGAPDDRFEGGKAKARASNDYLGDAIESALAGETVDPEQTDAPGAELAVVGADVTFHRDVAPILWTHCVECHRPGQVGPMSFLDVDEATGWAPQIAEIVGDGRMPPWHADPRFGHFKNERRLTETEKQTLARWAEGGAKAGDPKDAPPAPTFADPEWKIGTPDLVLELPEEQAISAEGVMPYRYVPLDPKFTEDRWLQMAEVRPSARAATHHVIAYLLPPGMSSKDALRNPATVLELEALGGYAPGSDPMVLPDGEGTLVPKGATVLFELHYTPIGKAMKDRTRIGLKFSRVPVTRVVQTGAAMNFRFRIPPRKPDATFGAQHRFTAPAQILTLTPHMHKRGKGFRYELEHADGTKRVLLDVPNYDFNWQHTYLLEKPVPASAGDVLRVTAIYDNSKDNRFNPNPDAWVTWGDQTFEEMLIGYFDYVEPRAAKQ